MHHRATPGSGWRSAQIAGPDTAVSTSAPSIVVCPDGRADVVVAGPGGALTYHWATPGSGWRNVHVATAAQAFAGTSMFVRPDGQVGVVAHGPGSTLMYYRGTPGSGWPGTRLQ